MGYRLKSNRSLGPVRLSVKPGIQRLGPMYDSQQIHLKFISMLQNDVLLSMQTYTSLSESHSRLGPFIIFQRLVHDLSHGDNGFFFQGASEQLQSSWCSFKQLRIIYEERLAIAIQITGRGRGTHIVHILPGPPYLKSCEERRECRPWDQLSSPGRPQ